MLNHNFKSDFGKFKSGQVLKNVLRLLIGQKIYQVKPKYLNLQVKSNQHLTQALLNRDAAGQAGHGSGRVRQIFTGRVGSRVSKF